MQAHQLQPFSFVQLVRNGDDLYALKRVLIQVPEHEQMVTREVNAHNMLSHPNVMSLVDYEVVSKGDDKEARLLFPYYKNGSIQELIENSQSRGDRIAEKKILNIFRSLCDAVDEFHCHNPPYAHRDIKPHNVLFKDDGNICLMDMGSVDLARVNVTCRADELSIVSHGGEVGEDELVRVNLSEALAMEDKCAQECTAAFRAPELFNVQSQCVIDERTDVWSLGCTLYAMAYYNSPCDGSALSALSGRIRIPEDSRYSLEFNDLIFYILQVEPNDRPFVKDIIKKMDSRFPGENT
eukprot:gene6779-7542_t